MLFSSLVPLTAQTRPAAQVPQAGFSATPLNGSTPLNVSFANNSTAATGYEWHFGDGTISTEANPGHIYTQRGVYTVSLQAGDGTTSIINYQLPILSPPPIPTPS